MSGWITSLGNARRHGVYALAKTPPRSMRAIGTGVVALVGQFPWGPAQTLTTPASFKEFSEMFAPEGMSRTGYGYLSCLAKAFPVLKVVRVMDATGTATADADLPQASPSVAAVVTVVAKYPGTAGNSIVCTVSTASDGDSNHFNLTVSVTGASGYTEDKFYNLNYSATGTRSTPTFTDKKLVSAITFVAAGRPDNGSVTCTGGLDGTVAATDYVGTPGSGNRGLALLENDLTIRHVCVDYPGASDLATVNAAVKAHVTLMQDRVGYINDEPTQAVAATQSDADSYRSDRVVYVDPWVYIYDDTTGAEQLVPPAPFAASVAAQLSPSTSIGWKDLEVGNMLSGIVRLESPRGNAAADNTDAGIVTIIEEDNGGFRFECGKVTAWASDPTNGNLTRTRMGDYIALSFSNSARPFVDSPNVPANWVMEVGMLDEFMAGLIRNKADDPNHKPYVDAYSIGDLNAANSPTDLANGDFSIPLDVRIGSSQERIILNIRHGESVTVSSPA